MEPPGSGKVILTDTWNEASAEVLTFFSADDCDETRFDTPYDGIYAWISYNWLERPIYQHIYSQSLITWNPGTQLWLFTDPFQALGKFSSSQ